MFVVRCGVEPLRVGKRAQERCEIGWQDVRDEPWDGLWMEYYLQSDISALRRARSDMFER